MQDELEVALAVSIITLEDNYRLGWTSVCSVALKWLRKIHEFKVCVQSQRSQDPFVGSYSWNMYFFIWALRQVLHFAADCDQGVCSKN